MENKEKAVLCKLCNTRKAFTHCLGCGIPICDNCVCDPESKFGSESTCSLSLCPMCIDDPAINPDAEPRKMDA